jgi:ATP-dependent Clp protease protease subunit
LADAVDLVRPPVKALVRGVLRGPAAAVLCACEHRAAHHNALFVLSLPVTAMTASSSADVVHLTQQLELQEAQLRRRLVATTGRTDEEVAEDLRSGRFLTADEAKDYGLLHEVV